MLILAADTTSPGGSLALAEDDDVVAWSTGRKERTHGEQLVPAILSLVGKHGRRLAEIDVFAVVTGPGSFTGLRIGIATMQGLAFAAGRPLVGVSGFEAAAATLAGGRGADLVGVWFDARRGEVYTALYAVTHGTLELIDEPRVVPPETACARWAPFLAQQSAWLVGDGVDACRAVLGAVPNVTLITPAPLLAPVAARLARRVVLAGERPLPHAVRPVYVRRPDAELARDRRASGRPHGAVSRVD